MPWEQNQREALSDRAGRSGAIAFIIFFYSKAEYHGGEKQTKSRIPVPGYIWQYLQPASKKGAGSTAPVVMPFSKSGSEGSSQRNGQSHCLDIIPVKKHIQSLKGIRKVVAMPISIILNDFVWRKRNRKRENTYLAWLCHSSWTNPATCTGVEMCA